MHHANCPPALANSRAVSEAEAKDARFQVHLRASRNSTAIISDLDQLHDTLQVFEFAGRRRGLSSNLVGI